MLIKRINREPFSHPNEKLIENSFKYEFVTILHMV
jgi:hypothetical protein